MKSKKAEGYGRQSKAEYIQFLHIALGSLRELDTQLTIVKRVELVPKELISPVIREADELQSILVASLKKLKA